MSDGGSTLAYVDSVQLFTVCITCAVRIKMTKAEALISPFSVYVQLLCHSLVLVIMLGFGVATGWT